MAAIGLCYVVSAPLNEDGKTYGTGFVVGEAIKASINITTAGAKLYADDKLSESDDGFVSGTLGLGVAAILEENKNTMLGHTTTDGEDGEMVANVNDSAPNMGVGFYSTVMRKGKRKYRAIWLKKGKFVEPSEELKTKEGSTTFTTPEITFNFEANDDGDWKNEKLCNTAAEAVTYLKTKANIK